MARQIINVGTAADTRTGDNIRVSFQKSNANFSELYTDLSSVSNRVLTLENSPDLANTEWTDANTAWTFNCVDWSGGVNIRIDATPTEYANVVTYDSRTDSSAIYFVWDQNFIDDIWNGTNHPIGEGQGFEMSYDNITWFHVSKSGYSGGTFFYFTRPDGVTDLFTYDVGQTVYLRFNRGSERVAWFDIENAPVSANTILSVDLSAVGYAIFDDNVESFRHLDRYVFAAKRTPYIPNIGEGGIVSPGSSYIGAKGNLIRLDIKNDLTVEDQNRIYCSFFDGESGNILIYWNAKLYTRTI